MKELNIAAGLIVLALLLIGCVSSTTEEESLVPADEGFAIYLPAHDLPIDALRVLSHIELGDEPILSVDDILLYSKETHEIELKPSVTERLAQLDLSGKAFVISVGREPVYAGAFMAPYFSRTFDGVVIMWPPDGSGGATIRIQRGYPGPDFFSREDPRSDLRILESLEQAGKLNRN